MNNINTTILAGKLTDIYDGNSFVAAKVCVDTGRKRRDSGEPVIQRFGISAYGHRADSLRKMQEGDSVIVEGRFTVSKREGKDDNFSVTVNTLQRIDGGNKNNVTIHGRLTRDPDIRTTSNGGKMVTSTVACDHSYPDKSKNGEWITKTSFIPIVFWGEIDPSLKKGSAVWVDGSLRPNSFEKDGQRHYVTQVLVSSIVPAGAGKNSTAASTTPTNAVPAASSAPTPENSIEDEDDEELPF